MKKEMRPEWKRTEQSRACTLDATWILARPGHGFVGTLKIPFPSSSRQLFRCILPGPSSAANLESGTNQGAGVCICRTRMLSRNTRELKEIKGKHITMTMEKMDNFFDKSTFSNIKVPSCHIDHINV